MLGAIVGDIIGSQFEHTNHLSKTFDLFTPDCFYSDDTVLTLAVCQALLDTDGQVDHLAAAADKHLADFANTYWKLSYGSQFNRWRIAEVRTPYFSCGNGSAARNRAIDSRAPRCWVRMPHFAFPFFPVARPIPFEDARQALPSSEDVR